MNIAGVKKIAGAKKNKEGVPSKEQSQRSGNIWVEDRKARAEVREEHQVN